MVTLALLIVAGLFWFVMAGFVGKVIGGIIAVFAIIRLLTKGGSKGGSFLDDVGDFGDFGD